MNFSQFVEAGVVLILIKALVEPTAVHLGQMILAWLDLKLFGIIPDFLHKKDQ
jgi:hypothetical protein